MALIPDLSPTQQKIYDGLRSIGPEIAGFYRDGLRLLADESFSTRSNLLAHCAREIDGGLREVLAPKMPRDENSDAETKGHVSSILNALGIGEENPLAQKWLSVAKHFHGYAHRHGAYRSPREIEKFLPLWQTYEEVLYTLVGGYFSLEERLRRMTQCGKPTDAMLEALTNLLDDPALAQSFFSQLKELGWFVPLRDRGFFNISRIPEPYQDEGTWRLPHAWAPMPYLEWVGMQNAAHRRSRIEQALIGVVQDYVTSHRVAGARRRNWQTDRGMARVLFHLAQLAWNEAHFEFLAVWVNADAMFACQDIMELGIPRLLNQDAHASVTRLLLLFLKAELAAENRTKLHFPVRDHTVIKGFIQHLPILPPQVFEPLYQRCLELIDWQCRLQPWYWKTHFERRVAFRTDEDPYGYEDAPEKMEMLPTRLATGLLVHYQGADLERHVKELAERREQVYQLMALHVIRRRFTELKSVFWALPFNPFLRYGLRIELASLVRENGTQFTSEEEAELVRRICRYRGVSFGRKPNKTEREAHRNRIVRLWLELLSGSPNPNVQAKLALYRQKDDPSTEADLSYFSSNRVHIRWGGDMPETATDMEKWGVDELVRYLHDFDEVDRWGRRDTYALGRCLQELIKTNPGKYLKDVRLFGAIPNYWGELFFAAEELASSGKMIFWEPLIDFVHQVVSEERFYNPETYESRSSAVQENTRRVAFLLLKSNQGKEHEAMPLSLMPKVENILFQFQNRLKSDESDDRFESMDNPYLMRAFNSTAGAYLMAAITYWVRYQRQFGESAMSTRQATFRQIFGDALSRFGETAHAVFGLCLPKLFYVDAVWSKHMLPAIFPEQDRHWRAAFSSYIGSNSVYGSVYLPLREAGHYQRALHDEAIPDEAGRNVGYHIGSAYLAKIEKLDDPNSLLNYLIQVGSPKQLAELVNYFWLVREEKKTGKLPAQDRPIRDLGRVLVPRLLAAQEDYAKAIQELVKWLPLFRKLDKEACTWVKLAIPHLNDYRQTMFIEDLMLHAPHQPKLAADLLLHFIQEPRKNEYYEDGPLSNLIQILYQQGERDIADTVCDRLGRMGNFPKIKAVYLENRRI